MLWGSKIYKIYNKAKVAVSENIPLNSSYS